jgi:predicted phosphodiesterase
MSAPAVKALRRMFRIQYVSDLHLEFYEKAVFPQLITPNARYLALAGDIGQPGHRVFHSFLDYVSKNWDHVFYVPGNHEYYTKPYTKWKYSRPTPFHERHTELRSAVRHYENIHFLDSESPSYYCEDENVAIIGSTLWSNVPDERLVDARLEMNDYTFIPISSITDGGIRRLHPDDTNQFHTEARTILNREIDTWEHRGAAICILTHHMPSFELISPRYRHHHLNCCFASACEDLMRPCIKAWIYGHTHNAAITAIGQTITACNARGYPNESVPGFGRDVYLEFKTISDEEITGDEELYIAASTPLGGSSTIGSATSQDEEIEFM